MINGIPSETPIACWIVGLHGRLSTYVLLKTNKPESYMYTIIDILCIIVMFNNLRLVKINRHILFHRY